MIGLGIDRNKLPIKLNDEQKNRPNSLIHINCYKSNLKKREFSFLLQGIKL